MVDTTLPIHFNPETFGALAFQGGESFKVHGKKHKDHGINDFTSLLTINHTISSSIEQRQYFQSLIILSLLLTYLMNQQFIISNPMSSILMRFYLHRTASHPAVITQLPHATTSTGCPWRAPVARRHCPVPFRPWPQMKRVSPLARVNSEGQLTVTTSPGGFADDMMI